MTNPVVLRRLYRSLLKASKPFSPLHNPRAAVYTSLLHRTGIDDGISWDRVLQQMAKRQETMAAKEANNDNNSNNERTAERRQRSPEQARDLTRSYVDDHDDDDDDDDKWLNEEGGGFNQSSSHHDMETSLEERRLPYRVLFRRLLREVVTGLDGSSQMKFPSQVVPNTLQEVIQREFRRPATTTTTTTTGDNGPFPFDEATRQQAAFIALRELNTKLSWIDSLLPSSSSEATTDQEKERNQRQAAKGVTPIHPLQPSEYLKAGTFLVAHPLLTGYFRRTVVCILDHSERQGTSNGGTYGLVVNRIGVSPSTGKDQTLTDVLRTIPPPLAEVFGESSVRDGGPVHMSIQMIHSAESPQQPSLGGTVLLSTPTTQNTTTTTPTTTKHPTDRSIYYQGDIIEAAEAVSNGQLDRGKQQCEPCFACSTELNKRVSGDISFYVGASCWEVRQLESEIERGYWLPCQGPPSIALSGTCEHNVTDTTTTNERPKNDLWLSMMCALGHEEGNLAHLVLDDTGSEHGDACDSF